tara:strand:- start:17 stop:436 length:420 start_codon:yes stop_codon:yes gene_type:complete
MRKKLFILGTTLLLSLTSFSQKDTNKVDSVLILPYSIAVQVAEDLVRYDECKEVLATSLELLDIANEKMYTQQLIIDESTIKYVLCRDQVDLEQEQSKVLKKSLADLSKQNKSLKNQRNLFGAGAGAAILTTILVLFIK